MVRIPSADFEDTESINEDDTNRTLTDLNEWAIIEMQGDLESRIGDAQLEGKFVGDLHFTKAGQTPVLIIGHHILYGKVSTLEKPLVIMEKCQKGLNKDQNISGEETNAIDKPSEGNEMELDDQIESGESETTETVYNVRAIIKKKLLFKSRPKPIIANVPKKI